MHAAQKNPPSRRLDASQKLIDRQVARRRLIPALIDPDLSRVVVHITWIAPPQAGQREQPVGSKKRIARKPMGESKAILIEVAGKHRGVCL